MRYLSLLLLLLLPGNSFNMSGAPNDSERPWRSIPLIKDGKVSDDWAQAGWGRFVVDGDAIRTDPDERGLGLLVYTRERLGNCQIRVVFKGKTPKSNSGFYIRIDDGILNWTNKESPAVQREANGKLSPEMLKKLTDASDAEAGAWYAVHHGFEVQIMDQGGSGHGTGSIYSLADAAPLPKAKPDGWRTMVVTLRGNVVEVDLDGKRLSSFDSEAKDLPPRRSWTEPKREAKRPQAGFIGLQTHDPGDVVWFKEISVRE